MALKLKKLMDNSKYSQLFNLTHLQAEPPIIEDFANSVSFNHFKTDGSNFVIFF